MTQKTRLRGGEILARALKEKGVDHVFTLAGGFCNPALEGFMNCQMPVINCPPRTDRWPIWPTATHGLPANLPSVWWAPKGLRMRCRQCLRRAVNGRQ